MKFFSLKKIAKGSGSKSQSFLSFQPSRGSRSAGLSLIETVIYVALLVLIVTIVITAIISMVRAQKNIKSHVLIQESVTVAMDKIVREIRDAKVVDIASVFGTNPGTLKLNGTDLNGNSRVVEFYVDSGRIMMEENNVVIGPLTLSSVTVTNLIFRFIDTAASDAVRVELTLSSGTGAEQKTENFYTTAILRSSY